MKSTRTRIAAMVALALALALVPVAGVSAQSQSGEEGQEEKLTFIVGTTDDLNSANPFGASDDMDYEVLILAYDLLHNYSQSDLSAVPGLAESYEVSEDGKTWTFKIREGVKWSDGTPLTAHDVAFSFNFVWKNKGVGIFRSYVGIPKSFTAPDDTTFVWEMEEPTTAPLIPPQVPIIPEHIWKHLDGKDATEIEGFKNVPAVGSGPFVLEDWKPGEFTRLSANKEYWGGAPVIDEVIFRVFQNQEAMVLALKSGEIDFAAGIEPSLFDSLQSDPTIETVTTNVDALVNLAFNLIPAGEKAAAGAYGGDPEAVSTAHPALQDVDVRRAIAHTVDKQALVDSMLLGYGSVGDSFLLPVYATWYKPAEGDQVHEFDLAEANRLYDEGGYLDTDGDGVREMPNGGEPFVFDLVAIAEDTYSVDASKLIKGWLEQTGWKVDLLSVSERRALDIWGTSEFDAYVWGWNGRPDPDFMLSIFTTGECGVWSDGCYSDKAYDEMYEAQRLETDLDKRTEIVFQMQDKIYEDVPEVILFYTQDMQAYRKDRWTGFVPQPEPDGSLIFSWGPYSYQQITPLTNPDGTTVISTTSAEGGIPGIAWVGIAAVAGVLLFVVIRRLRRKSDEDQA